MHATITSQAARADCTKSASTRMTRGYAASRINAALSIPESLSMPTSSASARASRHAAAKAPVPTPRFHDPGLGAVNKPKRLPGDPHQILEVGHEGLNPGIVLGKIDPKVRAYPHSIQSSRMATTSWIRPPVLGRKGRHLSDNVRRFMTPREPSDSSAEGCPAPFLATTFLACAGSGRRPRYMNPVCYLLCFLVPDSRPARIASTR